jgi:hypothetical protein
MGQTSQVSITGLSPAVVAPNGALSVQMRITNTGVETWDPISTVSCKSFYSALGGVGDEYETLCRPYPMGAGDYGIRLMVRNLDSPDWINDFRITDLAFPHPIAAGETINLTEVLTANLPPGRYRLILITQRAWYYAFTSRILHSPAEAEALGATADFVVASDVTPPAVSISGQLGNSCALWPPNGKLVQVGTISASDSHNEVSSVKVDVTSNDPTMAADEDVIVEGGATGPMTVKLRARRSGFGGDRVYNVVIMATDSAGNAAVVTNQCVVPHDQGK